MRGLAVIALAACAAGEPAPPDDGVAGLAVHAVGPAIVVPGTTLIVTGAFDAPVGGLALHLRGDALDATWPATFVDPTTLHVAVGAIAGDADLHGTATVELTVGRDRYATAPIAVDLALRTALAPAPAAIAGGVIFVNDGIEITGDGFLLGGGEGTTVARVAGCFTPEAGGGCAPIAEAELALIPAAPGDRTRASFPFAPRIAGIRPGAFTGTVTLENRLASGAELAAAPRAVALQLVAPEVQAAEPPAASLGQYVIFDGGGFAGGEGAVTELELDGTFTPTGGAARPFATTLIPEIVAGRRARYVITEDDALGHALDLRRDTGAFAGTVTPVVSYGRDRVRGAARPIQLAIAPIKQVVALEYRPSFVEGLRDFGLRAVDARIRARIAAACAAAYAGVNLELRDGAPADFALYEDVELLGVDPNDQGLFGYDNSPGKDVGNLRLYDRLGGVNARTQADGYAGYGGVFLRSLFGFSTHPGELARPTAGADPAFDQIFDPFRPDRGGAPVSSADLVEPLPEVTGAACPAADRPHQIACAILVLGNLIGGTLAHEVGHSLGLADPDGAAFHDPGDAPGRLMDAGDARPFLERAELAGQGPAVFCADEHAYLRAILPGPAAAPITRPACK